MCGTPQRSRSTVTSRRRPGKEAFPARGRSEEHTSELQSQSNLVCRLLLEKKKTDPVDVSLVYHFLHSHSREDGAQGYKQQRDGAVSRRQCLPPSSSAGSGPAGASSTGDRC